MTRLRNIITLIYFALGGSVALEFQFLNRCSAPLWVGIVGSFGKRTLEGGGFALKSKQRFSVEAPYNWSGRFWGRTGCVERKNASYCLTGDCGNGLRCDGKEATPPVTLAEITLKGALSGLDFYDISLVDGFNLPLSIEPIGGQGDNKKYSCKRTACARNLNYDCPKALRLNIKGRTHGCKSACSAFNTDLYCCRNNHNKPQTCRQEDFPVNYPKFFKDRCPNAYSYAYDHTNTYSCIAPGYLVTFC